VIDMHTHVLHNVDDGPETLEEAVGIMRLAARQGITQIIATPHFKVPKYRNKRVAQSYEELKEALETAAIDISLYLGNEIFMNEETIRAVDDKEAYALAGSNFLLVELPEDSFFGAHERMLYELQLKNYGIILAHVERYDYLTDNPDLLKKFVYSGCYVQITASALLNPQTKKKASALIKNGLVHLVATDCHNGTNRAPRLLDAYETVVRSFGKDLADNLFYRNALAIIGKGEVLK